jgi:(2S)-methylsuccinyl-CoA dehydrogenase
MRCGARKVSGRARFDDWYVPEENLVGGEAGRGRGFALQMAGFAAGRLQTAARANGLMQAAIEAALRYGREREVFGRPVLEHDAAAAKLAPMLGALLSSRALTAEAARRFEAPEGARLAAMAKLFASRAAERVAREAQQLHGGMGYTEEFAVSRYFVDARVLAIFEGAEEVLAVRVVAPALLERHRRQTAA